MTNQTKCPLCGRDVPEFEPLHNIATCECSLVFSMHDEVLYFRETLCLADYLITKTRPSFINPKRRVSNTLGVSCPNCSVRIPIEDLHGGFHRCSCGVLVATYEKELVCRMPLSMPRKKPITGYPGPMGAMIDMGRFQIMSVQSRDNRNSGAQDFCFMCINDQNERVWFKTSEESLVSLTWLNTIGRDLDWSIPLATQGFAANLRGKIQSIEEQVTIVTHAKFKNIASIY